MTFTCPLLQWHFHLLKINLIMRGGVHWWTGLVFLSVDKTVSAKNAVISRTYSFFEYCVKKYVDTKGVSLKNTTEKNYMTTAVHNSTGHSSQFQNCSIFPIQ